MLELLNGKETKSVQVQGLCETQAMEQDGTQVVGCYCIQIPPNLKTEHKKSK